MAATGTHAPLHERVAHLARMFFEASYEEDRSENWLRMFIRDHGASLADFARELEENYAPLSTGGEIPSNAQAIALGRFLRSRFAAHDVMQRIAYVTRGGAGLPDDYVHVRFGDGFEGGIDREGRVST